MSIASLILVASLLIPSAPLGAADSESAEETSAWDAKVTDVQGFAYLFEAGEVDGVPVSQGAPLEDGDRIVTGSDGVVEIAFESDSVISLGRNTTFTVDTAAKESSHLTLTVGSMVAKFRSLWSGKPWLAVYTPTAVAAVRGTEFLLEVGDSGETTVGVFDEGQIAVSVPDASGVEETLLNANEETTIGHGEGLDTEEREGRRFLRKKAHQRRRQMVNRMEKLRSRRREFKKNWMKTSSEKRRRMRKLMREKRAQLSSEQREKIRQMIQNRGAKLEKRREHLKDWKERRGKSMKEFKEKMLKHRAGMRERQEDLREKVKERRENLREKPRERKESAEEDQKEGLEKMRRRRRERVKEKIKRRRGVP